MERTLTANDLARIFGVTLLAIRNYTNQGMPRTKQFNGRLLYNFDECIEWMKKRFKNRDFSVVIENYKKEGN